MMLRICAGQLSNEGFGRLAKRTFNWMSIDAVSANISPILLLELSVNAQNESFKVFYSYFALVVLNHEISKIFK